MVLADESATTNPVVSAIPISAGPHRQGLPRFRVLIVDDHADTAELFRLFLVRRGHDVVTAHSVHAALEAAENTDFDVMLSDIHLPDGDGCRLLAELRQKRWIPAIAISGVGGTDVERSSRQAGFDEHFVKPANIQRVLRCLEELLARGAGGRSSGAE